MEVSNQRHHHATEMAPAFLFDYYLLTDNLILYLCFQLLNNSSIYLGCVASIGL